MNSGGLLAPALLCAACGAIGPGPPEVTTAEAADALFETTSTCEADVAGYAVEVTYPATWFAAEDCSWFDPDPPEVGDGGEPRMGAIEFGAVPFTPIQGREPTSGTVDGKPWIRVFETTRDEDTTVRHLVYYITLDPIAEEPTMVAATSTSASNDHELNAAVLDRMIESLDFRD